MIHLQVQKSSGRKPAERQASPDETNSSEREPLEPESSSNNAIGLDPGSVESSFLTREFILGLAPNDRVMPGRRNCKLRYAFL